MSNSNDELLEIARNYVMIIRVKEAKGSSVSSVTTDISPLYKQACARLESYDCKNCPKCWMKDAKEFLLETQFMPDKFRRLNCTNSDCSFMQTLSTD